MWTDPDTGKTYLRTKSGRIVSEVDENMMMYTDPKTGKRYLASKPGVHSLNSQKKLLVRRRPRFIKCRQTGLFNLTCKISKKKRGPSCSPESDFDPPNEKILSPTSSPQRHPISAINPTIFLTPPWELPYNNFEGEHAPGKRDFFWSKIFQKNYQKLHF